MRMRAIKDDNDDDLYAVIGGVKSTLSEMIAGLGCRICQGRGGSWVGGRANHFDIRGKQSTYER